MTGFVDFLQFVMIVAPYLLVAILCLLLWKMNRLLHGMSGVTGALIAHEERMKMRGIYAIECAPTQAVYFGSTQVNFHTRWGQHIAALMRGNHSNPRLQQDWNMYGPREFRFLVVEAIEQPELIEAREREILQHRAMHVLPAMNYNVNHSRVYAVPAVPDIDPAPVAIIVEKRRPRPPRSSRPVFTHVDDELRAILRNIGLTQEEIAGLESLEP